MKIEKLSNFSFILLGVIFVLVMGNTTIKRDINEAEDIIIGILS